MRPAPTPDEAPVSVRTASGASEGSGPIIVPGRAASVRTSGADSSTQSEAKPSLFRDVVAVAMDDERPATFEMGPEPGPARSRQTQWILIGAILIVIVALVFAVTSITSGLRESVANPLGTTTEDVSSAAPSSEAPPAEAAPAPAAEQPAAPAPAAPTITGITIDDPDHPEDTGRLTDGDPGSVWKSKQYRSPTFGNLKPGIGLTVNLAAPSTVTDVVVSAGDVTGGKVELKAQNPDGSPGEVLATGTFNGPGDIHLTPAQPLQAQAFIVWIPVLPQNGSTNVAQISEIRVA